MKETNNDIHMLLTPQKLAKKSDLRIKNSPCLKENQRLINKKAHKIILMRNQQVS